MSKSDIGISFDRVSCVVKPDEAHFWATHAGAELDLLMLNHHRCDCSGLIGPSRTNLFRFAFHVG